MKIVLRKPNVTALLGRGEYLYAACGELGIRLFDISMAEHKGFAEKVFTAPASPAGAPGPATRDTIVAEARDFMFRPARLTVAVGTTVLWTNAGQMVHTVTAADGSFDSGPIETGRRRPLAFTRPGTFPFHCTPHPFMRGEIVVR